MLKILQNQKSVTCLIHAFTCIHFFLNACNCPFKTFEKQRFQLYLSYNRRPSGSVQTSRVIQHCNHINSHTLHYLGVPEGGVGFLHVCGPSEAHCSFLIVDLLSSYNWNSSNHFVLCGQGI